MGSRRVSKTRTALRAVIFVLIAVLGIGLISGLRCEQRVGYAPRARLLPRAGGQPRRGAHRCEPALHGYSAPLAWRDYSFTSYPLAVSNIPARLYGSLLTEAVNRQHPKLIVVDIDGFLTDGYESSRPTSAVARQYALVAKPDRDHPHLRAGAADLVYFQHRKYHANWYQRTAAGAAASARDGQDRLLAHEEL
ncbi:MAG: hypothetical protein ACLTG4_00605 [Oscillospiraceae bacterium]